MHTKVLRGLRIRDTPILDQPHSLKLELTCKLPSLHGTPPVPSKHLTRCLRNRVQARASRLAQLESAADATIQSVESSSNVVKREIVHSFSELDTWLST